jgi:hypothetical protein
MCCVGWVIKKKLWHAAKEYEWNNKKYYFHPAKDIKEQQLGNQNTKKNLHAAKESSKRYAINEQQLGNQKTKKTYMQQKNPAKDIKEQHLGFQQLGSQKTKNLHAAKDIKEQHLGFQRGPPP